MMFTKKTNFIDTQYAKPHFGVLRKQIMRCVAFTQVIRAHGICLLWRRPDLRSGHRISAAALAGERGQRWAVREDRSRVVERWDAVDSGEGWCTLSDGTGTV